MLVLLLFAFISGLVTILAPCIWPLLPIILSSNVSGGKRKPLGIVLGIMASFTVFTLTLSYIVKIIPFDPDLLRYFAVVVIGFLGLTLIIPSLTQKVEYLVSRFSNMFSTKFSFVNTQSTQGFESGLAVGVSLGLIWSPCAGPILATIATLAATRAVNLQILFVTLAFVTGVGIPLFILATVGNKLFQKSRAISAHAKTIQQVFGVIMIVTAVVILFNYDKTLQAKLLDAFPSYTDFLIKLESNEKVEQALDALKGEKSLKNMDTSKLNFIFPGSGSLPNLGRAPEFAGITHWLNTQNPLTMESLKGKVVLIDFWTYTCINCIRTLPHVTNWYEKYKNDNFVIVGVHTPEFEFEKKTENVEKAIAQYNITYPVAQDNDYKTWRAYANRYWPAHYLVDANGYIRYTHFGEGNYAETEQAIQALLTEAGMQAEKELSQLKDVTPTAQQTPETYLGWARLDRLASNEKVLGGVQIFTKQPEIPLDHFAFIGKWDVQREEAIADVGSLLELNFTASKVFLVATPATQNDTVTVYLDGNILTQSTSGKDVVNSQINVNESRLYELIDLKEKKEKHLLRLEFNTKGTSVYAFTFE